MAAITLDAVTSTAGGAQVLNGVDLHVDDDELVVLLGQSGSGKTSILRAVAGFDPITSGRVLFDGVDMTDAPTRDRDVAIVFQADTLLRTHRVGTNIGFPLWVRKLTGRETRDRVLAESRALGIEEILDRWPDELSEGQQRLVQIARAMVRAPQVFLLDEPLAALDPRARTRLRTEIKTMQSGYGVSMIYGTHDPGDARAIGDRLAIVHDGRIIQNGTPLDLWRDPASRFIADLLGPMSYLDVLVERDGRGVCLRAENLRLRGYAPALGSIAGARAVIGVRPDAVRLDAEGSVAATVGPTTFEGSRQGRRFFIADSEVTTWVDERLEEEDRVQLRIDRFVVFDRTGRSVAAIG